MAELTLRKIPFTSEADNRLRMLKARTGLDRNYLCRMGFCLSLEEPGVPIAPEFGKGADKAATEIDRYTLLGQNGHTYLALMLAWMSRVETEGGDPSVVDGVFVAHMNRGPEILASRVRTLIDLAGLLP